MTQQERWSPTKWLPTWLGVVASGALIGCRIPLAFSGSNQPTPYTFEVTPDDLAHAASLDCDQTWFTGDAETDLPAAMAELDRYGVGIREGNPGAGGTALRGLLWVKEGFSTWSPESKVRLLRHELTHYCDRRAMGDTEFEKRYFHSAGRWVLETRAYVQTVRAMVDQGVAPRNIRTWIDRKVGTSTCSDASDKCALRDFYWLYDMDPDQFAVETQRILVSAIAG